MATAGSPEDAGAGLVLCAEADGRMTTLFRRTVADLLSFAAITDEPPSEIAAAGHDRCIIPIKLENIDARLNPDASDLAAMYAILDDREHPYYEHRLAA